jgi:iron complex outermembrane receptor protein
MEKGRRGAFPFFVMEDLSRQAMNSYSHFLLTPTNGSLYDLASSSAPARNRKTRRDMIDSNDLLNKSRRAAFLPFSFAVLLALLGICTIGLVSPSFAYSPAGAFVEPHLQLAGNGARSFRIGIQKPNEPLSPRWDARDTVYTVDPIVVTASRLPATFSRTMRNVLVITRDDIEHAPIESVEDLLEYAPGVDSRRRGPYGVQADASIRGGSFEQTLILIDGIKVTDPQTGHHNLDLPLQLDDVKRVEILKGHGSRLYGPNAFGGVINIITRRGDRKEMNFKAAAGEHDLADAAFSLSYPLGISRNKISVARSKSSGYRHNTDFDIWKGRWSSRIELGSLKADMALGYLDKRFGANGFYSELFPNQWEHTRTTFLDGGAGMKKDRLAFSSNFYWRHHTDEFLLDRERPDWYMNNHITDVYGIELQQSIYSRLGSFAIGGEAGRETIDSSNLGDHERTKGGIFAEYRPKLGERAVFTVGAFSYYYSDWGWKTWPGLDLGYKLGKSSHLYASIGRSFRVPTYTELYYASPANQGNPGLEPEEAWSYEAGFKWRAEHATANLSIFRREGRNLIDWVRESASVPWEARNIASINTSGVETGFTLDPSRLLGHSSIRRIAIGYTYIGSDKEAGNLESKYVLDHLEHQFICNIEGASLFQFRPDIEFRYEKRAGGESYSLLDAQLSRRFPNGELFIKATNLLNTDYTEIGGVPMPGRWLVAGIKVTLTP